MLTPQPSFQLEKQIGWSITSNDAFVQSETHHAVCVTCVDGYTGSVPDGSTEASGKSACVPPGAR